MIKTQINGKYELILPEHRALRPQWKTGWEVERIESMLSHLKKGDLVIDVGVEEGDISALLAQKTGKIVMFEPNVLVWPNIRAIWEANNLEMPKMIFTGFASDKDKFTFGDVTGKLWPDCAFGEIIGNHGFKELKDPGEISQIKIDTMFENIPEKIKLITIDVEGSESFVLHGAEKTILRDKPFIYVSVHPTFMADMFQQDYPTLRDYVLSLGYKENYLTYDHELQIFFEPV